MKKADEIRVREAMDRRLSSLEASALRRARIRQRIEREEEPEVRRKLTIGMALVLVAVLALGGVAVAAGLNLFDVYSDENPKLSGLAASSVLETVTPAVVETEELGTTTATITNAYYDGLSLIVGYSIENGSALADYEPTEEELEKKLLLEESPEFVFSGLIGVETEASAAALEGYVERCRKGEPFGFVYYHISVDSEAQTEAGALLPAATEGDHAGEGGTRYYLREFESPLPEEAQNLDSLNISLGLTMDASYYYFDGKILYCLQIPSAQELGEMTAIIRRTGSAVCSYAGEGEIDGVKVTAEAWMSPVYGQVTLRAEERVLDMPDPIWNKYRSAIYRPFIADAEGDMLRLDKYNLTDDLYGMEIGFNGLGEAELMEGFTLYLMHEDDMDGEWDYEDVFERALSIELNAAE